MRSLRGNRRVQFLAVTVISLAAFCLIGFLVYSILSNGGGGTTVSEAPTEPPSAEQLPTEVPTGGEASTPTLTPVINQTEQAEAEATAAMEAETTPTSTPNAPANAGDFSNPLNKTTVITTYSLGQLLTNADFEGSFNNGIAAGWSAFQNDGILALFTAETQPYIDSGNGAQRLTLVQATQQDRYAGIYQQVEVVPNKKYTLSLHGHIRSPFGDIAKSSYGYRLQYALDETGNQNWQAVTQWVELPWDERPLYGADPTLLSYTTEFTTTSNKLTLFVRGWNKWAVAGEAQYTLDNFSLVGPSAIVKKVALAPATNGNGETVSLIKNNDTAAPPAATTPNSGLLPVTGQINLTVDGRVWSGIFVLIGLVIGLIYRTRQRN